MTKKTGIVTEFIKKSGFKILILGIVLLVIIKKDFSFSIDLKSPQEKTPQEQVIPPVPPASQGQVKKESKITETYTEEKKEDLSKSSIIQSDTPTGLTYEQALAKVDDKMKEAYIRRFSHVAIDEMRKLKIPASVSLAQGILLSAAGTSQQALNGNNHFNLVCGKDWKNDKMNFDNGECFRAYASPWRSFRNHSELLIANHSYLTDLGTTDYQSWANGLQQANYHGSKDYAKRLIELVQYYRLLHL